METRRLLFTACLLLGCSAAGAAGLLGDRNAPVTPPASADANAFGTGDLSVLSINAHAALPFTHDGSTAWSVQSGFYRDITGGAVNHVAAVNLPTGASIERIALEACDDNGSDSVVSALWACGPTAADTCTVVDTAGSGGVISTGGSATPGCDRFELIYDTPHTADNLNNSYFMLFEDLAGNTNTGFRSARAYWRRQISPAPGTATFGDVPTGHPFFQHVEALVTSGITAGCGGGDYCPDDALTRGQLAVFLAAALGLHWPN